MIPSLRKKNLVGPQKKQRKKLEESTFRPYIFWMGRYNFSQGTLGVKKITTDPRRETPVIGQTTALCSPMCHKDNKRQKYPSNVQSLCDIQLLYSGLFIRIITIPKILASIMAPLYYHIN